MAFAEGTDLETGVFRVRPATSKRSLSSGMPARPAPGARSRPRPRTSTRPPHRHPPRQPPPRERPAAQRAPRPAPAARRPGRRPAAPGAGIRPDRPPSASSSTRPCARGSTSTASAIPLLGPLTTIGRDPSADIVLDDPGISRRHSEIRVTSDGPHLVTSIRDLASTNGTFVNGERITSTRLVDGDRLTVGRTSVTFRAGKR